MGWRDRQYSKSEFDRAYGGAEVTRRPPPVTLFLMILHGAAFFLILALAEGQRGAGPLALVGGSPISVPDILLYFIASRSLLTTAFVVLALWSLAGRVERRLGAGRLLVLYIIGNLAAGGAFAAVARAVPRLALAELDYPVGALAALCMVAVLRFWHEPAQVFGRVTTLGKVYAIAGGIVVGLVLLQAGMGAAAWLLAAAAGAGLGLASERFPHSLPRPQRRRRRRRPAVRPSIQPESRGPSDSDVQLDHLLEKISRSGMDSLTDRERAQLEEARQAKLHET